MEDTKGRKVVIREAKKEDMVEVDKMIQELAVFENLTGDARLSASDLIRDGFECRPGAFGCKVAEVDGQLTGYALYHRTYSTCTGHGLMLEDLYVRERMRRQGIGERLFNAVAKQALEQGCARLELHVLDWNPARSFYEARGAVDMTAARWRYYRLGTEALRQAAQRE
ncbi:unnamed protein product [Parnassius apollo]|uniref:(apollo) hypothetical protein n=1 Tax=Parnassius apollo TaxID=110799 RepID=A0A8S3WRG2_PARAO|nr:unnamed protein product [Parnassius apollo]